MTIFNTKRLATAIRLLQRSFRQYAGRFILVIGLGFLSGLSGALGIGAVIPLFSFLVGQGGQEVNFISRFITATFTFLHLPLTLISLALLIGTLFVVKAGVRFAAQYVAEMAVVEHEERLRRSLFGKTLTADWPFLLDQKIGYLEKVLEKDISVSASIITQISSLVLLTTSFVTYALVALSISAPITLITIGIGCFLFFALRPLLRRIKKLSQETVITEKEVAHFINESIIGAKMVKANASEQELTNRGWAFFRKLHDIRLKKAWYVYSVGSIFEPLGFIVIIGFLLAYHSAPSFQIASFAAIMYLIQKMFVFMQSSQGAANNIMGWIPYLESVATYRRMIRDHQESIEGSISGFSGDVIFKNVHFSYGTTEILAGIDVAIHQGEMFAIIGESGAGKTTFVDLLLGLLAPTSGMVLSNGASLESINPQSWRRTIGYVSQDVFLLNDTIRNNIKFYNQTISDGAVEHAVRMANISEFIASLPEGLDTYVGERGLKVSGGQRQRIALARALVRKPHLLVLDEATSALDLDSERLIQEAIEGLHGKTTVVLIAHRLSTVLGADKVVILERGKVVERGNPKQLLADNRSKLYRMYHGTI